MDSENNKRRIQGVIKRLINEPDQVKYLNELVLSGYKSRFKDFAAEISGQLNDKLASFYELNPRRSSGDYSYGVKIVVDKMDSAVKLLQNRIQITEEQDIKPIIKDGLTIAEMDFSEDRIKDWHQLYNEWGLNTSEKIESFKGWVRSMPTIEGDTPLRQYYIEKVKTEIKILEEFQPSNSHQAGSNLAEKQPNPGSKLGEDLLGIQEEEKETTQNATIRMKEAALVLVYEGKHVYKNNAVEILEGIRKRYKVSWTSAEKLRQNFEQYHSHADRTAPPETERQLNERIKLFERVKDLLTDNNQKNKVLEDIETMKEKYQNSLNPKK